jgi:hypothetical protein
LVVIAILVTSVEYTFHWLELQAVEFTAAANTDSFQMEADAAACTE